MASYFSKVGMNIKASIEERFEDGTYEKYLPPPSNTSLVSQKTNAFELTECVNKMKNSVKGAELVSPSV
ncbi:hypothetical protein QYM36_006120 [Artemia franciscana]|uniref:Uncharacterized protein n=1 Tax=Artemia franciscana TaxID=6661 RepID=A0AA88LAH3_ARTSF|nr:hypothetical protein QYM36_006120 [Artemia franciscana]